MTEPNAAASNMAGSPGELRGQTAAVSGSVSAGDAAADAALIREAFDYLGPGGIHRSEIWADAREALDRLLARVGQAEAAVGWREDERREAIQGQLDLEAKMRQAEASAKELRAALRRIEQADTDIKGSIYPIDSEIVLGGGVIYWPVRGPIAEYARAALARVQPQEQEQDSAGVLVDGEQTA